MSSRTWFTSDQHYGHVAVIRHSQRGFVDVDAMNESLIERHNALVREGDTVIHLGDFSWREQSVGPLLKRLHGEHHLIAGNHDKCHPCHEKHAKAVRRYLDYGFKSIEVRTTRTIGGVPVLLSHLPYRRDDDSDLRFLELRPVDRGAWLVHGHVHRGWQRLGRMINVGVDVWSHAPVAEDELVVLMRKREAA